MVLYNNLLVETRKKPRAPQQHVGPRSSHFGRNDDNC